MNNSSVSFCTFCYSADAPLLHKHGQLKRQIESNKYHFDEIIVVHQCCQPLDYEPFNIYVDKQPIIEDESHIDEILLDFGYDLDKPQYVSPTDSHHTWKQHNVNHIYGIQHVTSDYVLFCDADCIMKNPINWIDFAIEKLESDNEIFIVSPADGESERKTLRMSQQMFLVDSDDFRNLNPNQPGYTGNVKDYDTMPEYMSLLEGRLQFHCESIGKYRYVCPDKYRYWHCNKYDDYGHYEYDWSKY